MKRAHVRAFHAKTAERVARYTKRTTSNVTAARETLENTAMVVHRLGPFTEDRVMHFTRQLRAGATLMRLVRKTAPSW